MSAALTPRVRVLVVCDGIRASQIEYKVFNLRGARCQIIADSFPFRRKLRFYLVLASPRRGRFPAYLKVVNDQTNKAVFFSEIEPAPQFDEDDDYLPLDLLANIRFPQVGRYTVEVSFYQEAGPDVVKMEQPLNVLESEA